MDISLHMDIFIYRYIVYNIIIKNVCKPKKSLKKHINIM